MSKKNRRRESGWLSLRELSRALDVSQDHLRKSILTYVPADCQRRDGEKIMIYSRGAIEAWLGERVIATDKCEGCVQKQGVIDLLLDPEMLRETLHKSVP